MISVRHRSTKNFAPESVVVDVTSKSPDNRFRAFSPFHPVPGGVGISVPEGFFDAPLTSTTVEGAWQGLKVFENEGIDMRAMRNATMKGLKRNASKARGRILGHGLHHVAYLQSRKELYVPMYEQQMDALDALVQELVDLVKSGRNVVLLDYNTNTDVEDVSKPLSHASLVAGRVKERLADGMK
jgi:hypothetical protein